MFYICTIYVLIGWHHLCGHISEISCSRPCIFDASSSISCELSAVYQFVVLKRSVWAEIFLAPRMSLSLLNFRRTRACVKSVMSIHMIVLFYNRNYRRTNNFLFKRFESIIITKATSSQIISLRLPDYKHWPIALKLISTKRYFYYEYEYKNSVWYFAIFQSIENYLAYQFKNWKYRARTWQSFINPLEWRRRWELQQSRAPLPSFLDARQRNKQHQTLPQRLIENSHPWSNLIYGRTWWDLLSRPKLKQDGKHGSNPFPHRQMSVIAGDLCSGTRGI